MPRLSRLAERARFARQAWRVPSGRETTDRTTKIWLLIISSGNQRHGAGSTWVGLVGADKGLHQILDAIFDCGDEEFSRATDQILRTQLRGAAAHQQVTLLLSSKKRTRPAGKRKKPAESGTVTGS